MLRSHSHILILSLSLAVALAYLIMQVVIGSIEERFNKQLYEAGKISSELMVGYESQLLETERLVANVEGVGDALLARDPNALRSLTLGITANAQQEAVEFLDFSGNHVLSMHHQVDGNPEDYDFASGGQTEFTRLEIVKDILFRKSDARGDKFAELVQVDDGFFLYVAGPVYNTEGQLAGVVLVGQSVPTLVADMRARTFAQISLYDHSGKVIYSTLPFPRDLLPEQVVQAISSKDSSSAKRSLDVANIPFTEIYGVWEVRGNHQLGAMGVAVSQNPVLEASTSSRWRIFFLIATASLLVILIGINLANTITRPLLQLVQAAAHVAKGDLTIQVVPHSHDEVSVLTESLNEMVVSLKRSQEELVKAYDSTLEGWAKALELHDKETVGHSGRVTKLTLQLAEAMGIQEEALVDIRRGALLHDIGKMGIPDSILNKNDRLSSQEAAIVRQHPIHAYNMLKNIDHLRSAAEIPYCHHEKWNGTGYPRGLKGEEIPLSARIFAIVDVYDALINDRPYRKAIPYKQVMGYLIEQSGKHFDPKVVSAFLQLQQILRAGEE
ncbi:MAG: HD domain-containing phosphohydrolase [Anaerolineales bacterium]